MSTIGTTFQDGISLRSATHVNSLGLALKGMGITDDNAGDLILARSQADPFAFYGGDANLQSIAIPAAAATVVAGGKWLYVTLLANPSATNTTVTPSGGAAFNIAVNTANTITRRVGIVLGPGDTITTGTAGAGLGMLFSAPSDLTRVLREVTNASIYTVPVGKVFVATHIAYYSSASLAVVIDGVTGPSLAGMCEPHSSAASSGRDSFFARLVFKAGQTIASATAAALVLSGVEANA